MSCDGTRSKYQNVVWSGEQKRFIKMNYSAKVGVYRSHGSGDTVNFKSHVIPRDKEIERPLHLINEKFLLQWIYL